MSDHIGDAPGDVDELDERLGAHALDAGDGRSRSRGRGRVEDYLRINPRAAAEVSEHP